MSELWAVSIGVFVLMGLGIGAWFAVMAFVSRRQVKR